MCPAAHIGWNILSTLLTYICFVGKQRVLNLNGTAYWLHADDTPLQFLAAEDDELPPRSQQIVTFMPDVIELGDVLVQLSTRCITTCIAFASGLVRFDDAFAFVCATNPTS